jgi:hypothetical protein
MTRLFLAYVNAFRPSRSSRGSGGSAGTLKRLIYTLACSDLSRLHLAHICGRLYASDFLN